MLLTALMATLALQPSQPLIIAHRGASGYLPEHTLPAYALAFGQGADVIEPDVVLTKDNVLICNHDLTLERTTNVEAVFPDRKAEDGKWYVADFTWAEIQTLSVDGPRRPNEPDWGDQIRKARLSDMVNLVQAMNRRTGRNVGIIPEPKSAAFHRQRGKDLILVLHQKLTRLGYAKASDGCTIQSFEEDALKRLKEMGSALPRVFLASSAADIQRAGGLATIRQFAMGVGPNWRFAGQNGGAFLQEARAAGLKTYPWTFDADEANLRRFLLEHKVDGVFTDFPDAGRRALLAGETQ